MIYVCDYDVFVDNSKSTITRIGSHPLENINPKSISIYLEGVYKQATQHTQTNHDIFLNVQAVTYHGEEVWLREYLGSQQCDPPELYISIETKMNDRLKKIAKDFGSTPTEINIARFKQGNFPTMIRIGKGDENESTIMDGNT
jgi:hypothetical protein